MKRIVMRDSFVLLLAAASWLPGSAQEAATAPAVPSELPPTHNWAAENPLKIALLKWYQANLTAHFKTGQQPIGVAFDGANIWTANYGAGTVTKLRGSDGEALGTLKVGAAPYGVTFDGANMWSATRVMGRLVSSEPVMAKHSGHSRSGRSQDGWHSTERTSG